MPQLWISLLLDSLLQLVKLFFAQVGALGHPMHICTVILDHMISLPCVAEVEWLNRLVAVCVKGVLEKPQLFSSC